MKLLFVIHSLTHGGAERILLELAGNWSREHSVSILTLTEAEKDFYMVPSGVQRFAIPRTIKHWYNIFGVFSIIRKVRNIFKCFDPDFIISFLPKSNIFSLIAGLLLKNKIIVCERSIIRSPDIDRRQDFFRRWLYPHAYKITVQHDYIYHELLDVYPGIKPQKIHITPNPVKKLTTGSDEELDIHLYFPDFKNDDKLVIGVGRFTTLKAFKDLIIMFSIICKERTNIKLAILGDGSEYEECRELVKSLLMGKYVSLPGSIKNMAPWYNFADIFVTTTHFEGFPNALAESLAAGIPAVAFDAPSISLLLHDSTNGYIINDRNRELMAEKICFLFDNPVVYEKMSNEAKKITDEYSIENINKIWFNKVLV